MVNLLLLVVAVGMYFYAPWDIINRETGELE